MGSAISRISIRDDVILVRQADPTSVHGPDATAADTVRESARGREWQQQKTTQEDLNRVAEKLNRAAEVFDIQARFSVHKATGEIMVKIVNTRTGQVLREIPPERMLDVAASMEKLLGLIVDERA